MADNEVEKLKQQIEEMKKQVEEYNNILLSLTSNLYSQFKFPTLKLNNEIETIINTIKNFSFE